MITETFLRSKSASLRLFKSVSMLELFGRIPITILPPTPTSSPIIQSRANLLPQEFRFRLLERVVGLGRARGIQDVESKDVLPREHSRALAVGDLCPTCQR